MRELKSGTQLAGRYTLVSELGAGHESARASIVWLARDRITGAEVALKLVDPRDERKPELLRREWQICIRLIHAHIPRVFEFHDDEDAAFYAMQYISGPHISVLSAAPLADILAPVGLLADALRYAHAKDVVHRDLKASNVVIDANGAPYLVDFGVASVQAERVGGGSLIAASPQQLAGGAPEPADDIFALGGLIYELVSGRSPYSSANTTSDIRTEVPDLLKHSDGSDVPARIQQLVANMLDKNASARPDAETVATVLRDNGYSPGPVAREYLGDSRSVVDEVIESEAPLHVRLAPQAQRPAADEKSQGLSPKAVAISLAVLLALLLGVVFLLPKSVDNTPREPAATQREEVIDTSEELAPETEVERDERVQAREATEAVLGQLLAKMRTLESRAVERWGALAWRQVQEAYAAGDAAYLARNYAQATEYYEKAIEHVDPLLSQVDTVFQTTVENARIALDAADSREAVRLYELAVAISPGHGPSRAGLSRAQNLDSVIALTDQGFSLERDLELEAALQSFREAVEIDPEWRPARDGVTRVNATIRQMDFDARMTEGLGALADKDFASARAAFRMAKELMPESREPADGLLQVDQGIRLQSITSFERRASREEAAEEWTAAVGTYKRILELDGNLTFAQEGLAHAEGMVALHQQLGDYIENPDSLSAPRTMQTATQMLVGITRMDDIGPRLAGQRDELSRLLKRAATPLSVRILSDNLTDVSIYKVGKLGTFDATELTLRPGTYVAVGSRPGYRDVRLEFRVAPESEMKPVVVRCEEKI